MAHQHAHEDDASLADLVADGLLDAELAGLAWAVAVGGVGFLVAGPGGPAGAVGGAVVALAAAIADAVSLTTRVAALAPGSASGPVDEAVREAGHDEGVLVLTASDLGGAGEGALRRGAARAAIRAVSDRTGVALVGTIAAPDLEGVLDRLRGLTVAAPDDEIVRLGVVLILGAAAPGSPDSAAPAAAGRNVLVRVVAAHYLRPPTVGPLGRVEHRPPAVLATWDAGRGGWDHFGWGVVPELADRVGVHPAELEAAVAIRRETIEALVAHRLRGPAPFRAAANLALAIGRAGEPRSP